MEKKAKKSLPDKFERLLNLMEEEDFYVSDFLLCVCANLSNKPQNTFNTSFKLGDKFYEIQINRRTIQ